MTLHVDWIPAETPPTEHCRVWVKYEDSRGRVLSGDAYYHPGSDCIDTEPDGTIWHDDPEWRDGDGDNFEMCPTWPRTILAWAPFERPEVGA